MVLQEMMLKEFGWKRFYKGSNPRGNLTLSDYRREKAAEMAKEEKRKLEDIKDKSNELDEVQLTLTNKKNECLKRENEVLKAENRSLKAKLEKAYDFMRQFTINGMNMLEHFLRSIGEWVQQKVAGMSR